ncbi:histidine phosphatase family protein [Psychrobium sp. 1_MG-2023]|uniref:histidine phosphatase family protein n=1 Tax=Psychrobium sp. 1_MG-2023 TaxID=3062624 RepID=UPI0027338BC6|nr:histidine phosphatase family protein [Psychrobium sp. 1_MG-2023]MDP2560434.1 histidine phosphatase family protein [Psychrobium sp. 1_MG-2023]
MPTTLYLARHGETQWNLDQRLQGHLDSDLTTLGQQQSHQLATTLATIDITLIVSSPLGRAVKTASICQQHIPVNHIVVNELIERDLGEWQGKYVSLLQSLTTYRETLQQVTTLNIINGESALACGERLYHALISIAQDITNSTAQQNVLIIVHGEALRCLLHVLGHQSSNNAFELFKNGAVIKLNFESKPPYLTLCKSQIG